MTEGIINILLTSLRPLGDITRVTLLYKPSMEHGTLVLVGMLRAGFKF
jgi:hypothetical protein